MRDCKRIILGYLLASTGVLRAATLVPTEQRMSFYCNREVIGDLVDALIRNRNFLLRSDLSDERKKNTYEDEARYLKARFGVYHSLKCADFKDALVDFRSDLKDGGGEDHDTVVDPNGSLSIRYRPFDVLTNRCLPEFKVSLLKADHSDILNKRIISLEVLAPRNQWIGIACPANSFDLAEASIKEFLNDGYELPDALFARKVRPISINFTPTMAQH